MEGRKCVKVINILTKEVNQRVFPVTAGNYRVSASKVLPCPAGSKYEGGASSAVPCPAGRYTATEGANDCIFCPAQTYSRSGATSCKDCTSLGLDCSNGIIKLRKGYWYKMEKSKHLDESTKIVKCLNENACNVQNQTSARCGDNAGGFLCAVCNEGFVPDVSSTDGSCKECVSSPAERWTSKGLMLVIAAVLFFVFGVFFFLQRTPKLLIDKYLVKLNIRRIVRRARKRALLQIYERDVGASSDGSSNEEVQESIKSSSWQINMMQWFNFVEPCMLLSFRTSSYNSRRIFTCVDVTVNHAVEHIQHQVTDTVENRLEQELENAIGAPDLDSQQNENSLTGIRSSTMMMGLMKPLKNSLVSFIANARSMVATNQLKIVTGNLQINASLTVVFSIPWPPVHTQFLEMLNVFKLDLFKGLSFAVPCLHSSHFMSLTTFLAAPIVLLAVFTLAFIFDALLITLMKLLPQKCRRRLQKLPLCGATIQSAFSVTIKITLLVILSSDDLFKSFHHI